MKTKPARKARRRARDPYAWDVEVTPAGGKPRPEPKRPPRDPVCAYCGRGKRETLLIILPRPRAPTGVCNHCVVQMVERVRIYRDYARQMEIER